ncbi:hypothetical protein XELAEV_180101272mg, partial [Xenopus laevis]
MANKWLPGRCQLVTLTVLLPILIAPCWARTFTNHWAVRIAGGENEANRIASKYGYINIGQ